LSVLQSFFFVFSYFNVLALLVVLSWDSDSYKLVLYHYFNSLKFILHQLLLSRLEYLGEALWYRVWFVENQNLLWLFVLNYALVFHVESFFLSSIWCDLVCNDTSISRFMRVFFVFLFFLIFIFLFLILGLGFWSGL
jgi:hypothetical protein